MSQVKLKFKRNQDNDFPNNIDYDIWVEDQSKEIKVRLFKKDIYKLQYKLCDLKSGHLVRKNQEYTMINYCKEDIIKVIHSLDLPVNDFFYRKQAKHKLSLTHSDTSGIRIDNKVRIDNVELKKTDTLINSIKDLFIDVLHACCDYLIEEYKNGKKIRKNHQRNMKKLYDYGFTTAEFNSFYENL